MPHADFIHLRVHSAFSLSEGAIKVGDVVGLCRHHRMPAAAVTDTDNLFGALEFALAAAPAGVQPIIGTLLGVRHGLGGEGGGRIGETRRTIHRLPLLVQNEAGYRNLCRLSSIAHLETAPGEQPHIGLDTLARHADGLIALTGGPEGPLGALLADGQRPAAAALLDRLAAIFPGRLYVELQRHGLELEEQIEGATLDLAYATALPLVATNDVYFADAEDYEAHDALLCIAEGVQVAVQERRRLTPEHRFRSAAEMRAVFVDLPEACDNTLVIARRTAFMPAKRKPILPEFPTADGRSETDALRAAAAAGLEQRLAASVLRPDMDAATRETVARPYRERLDYELGVIGQMGFPGYFLIVAEFIQWAKEQGIPVGPGRGSGAGSVVAWALTITDLDPLRFGLLFERFLNPERVSMPDFDIDFCQDRRDEVIEHVREKYGADRVAQIITFGTLQARAVLRDVGRVLGIPYGRVDRICKLVPYNPAKPVKLKEAIEGEAELQRQRDSDETIARLIDIALDLEGLYRHASTHAAGVVIGDRALADLVPLYRDPRSPMAATQFSMKYVELAGLVKFDFLGLKTLTVLDRAVRLLAGKDVPRDLNTLALDDPATYRLLGRGETTGVFQLESAGMRDMLRQMKPDSFEDIIALVALYRPGPMENIPHYIACKHGREKPDYLHPSLEGILKETFGVIIYQEQVMQIAQTLSGYSLGGADLLRRAMGKKIKAEMEAQRETFVDGAVGRGVDRAQAAQIFDLVDKFAGYGFNKSHAAAYALVAYQTAWLKANHPVEFLAASMTLDLGNTDKLNVFRQELQRLAIPLLPPDINRSDVEFTVEPPLQGQSSGAVRYALAAIKGVGAQAMQAVVAERKANGPFRSIADVVTRLGARVLNRRLLESLIKAGAFDAIHANRRQLLEGAELLTRLAGAASNGDKNQTSLFGDGDTAALALPLPAVEDWPIMERLAQEFEAVGFYLSAHPLNAYGGSLARLGIQPSASISPRASGTRPRLAGVVIRKREHTSARGNRFAFVTFSDISGVFEVTVFADLLATARDALESGQPLLVNAEVRAEGDAVRLSATSIERLDAVVAESNGGLQLHLERGDPLERIRRAIGQSTRGKGRISIVLAVDREQEVEIALPGRYAISAELRAALGAVPGIAAVRDT
ncbi:MAG: DNA polymerase III subunit alpha [Alphaproteobacteria bacterium]|nr:DNA polymerase III subunit alpha [Alphaproteobacteria bacterium]